ncbi:hypothetical protein [Trichloromonas acetexigens]|jgi:hypothetical protein|uniref:Uncharacterized protein n=1 Tax=Trichloromonas acetexigens TaxID=38815 RepID=A0A550JFH8_9BACT|nr:hypothetical protein [Desulfuromonas acetexigens]TRO81967.1 hypothetical protein FL622_09225 [Desulfuromonas acetexigens]
MKIYSMNRRELGEFPAPPNEKSRQDMTWFPGIAVRWREHPDPSTQGESPKGMPECFLGF